MNLFEILNSIEPKDISFENKAKNKWNLIAMPLGGLGILGDDITKICAAKRTLSPKLDRKCVAVFCADNGVVAENISQTGSDVTAIVAENICNMNSSVCKMAQTINADVFPVDIGMNTEVKNEKIINLCVKRGTENFAVSPALTKDEVIRAIENGAKLAMDFSKKYDILAAGEMGIGNTTTSSAVASVLLSRSPYEMTGAGAGLSKEGILHKADVIDKAIKLHKPEKDDVIDVLSKVGGLDICAIAGFMIGAAYSKSICIIDGFIASVAALCAVKLCPYVKDYLLGSHVSKEKAGILILEALEIEAPINASMHLGEGTGAVALMPMLDMAANIFNTMITFEDSNIEAYKPL